MAGSGEVDPRRAGRVYAAAVTATARRNSALNNPSSNRESGAREAGPADKPNGTQAVWRAEFSNALLGKGWSGKQIGNLRTGLDHGLVASIAKR